jgi:hypothetical protein
MNREACHYLCNQFTISIVEIELQKFELANEVIARSLLAVSRFPVSSIVGSNLLTFHPGLVHEIIADSLSEGVPVFFHPRPSI